ncbi:MFS general substrate transporter [Venturia nashicola]|nr:MFS general substrate transporter [Venturia nashicola]
MIWLGWPICIAGLVAASFATHLGGLIVTQGVIYGVGFLLFYYPILGFVNEFWIERRGMAYGLLCSASGVSGVGMPFIITELLKKYGYPTTLRAAAIALALLTGPLIPTLKGRLPVSSSTTITATDWTFLKLPLFWVHSFSNLVYGLGFFFPGLYLPSYATSISLSPTTGALVLALLSISQVAGQFSFGYLSDSRRLINTLLITSTFISAIGCLTLWRFAHSLAPLIAFSLLYGFFGAGYTALWGRMVTSVSEEPMAHMAMFSFFNVGKGIGNVSAGPLSAALMGSFVSGDGRKETERFGPVILFTGITMFCSGVVVVAWVCWKRVWVASMG